MLIAIKEIGFCKGGKEIYDRIKADKVIVLEFDREGNFKRVRVEDFSEDKLALYLYKEAKGKNPPSRTPTLMLSDRKKLGRSLNNMKKALNSLRKLINNIPDLNLENAEEEIEVKLNEIPKKETILLTVNIEGKYIGEIEEFRRALELSVLSEGEESKGKATCFICREEKEVSGDISPFKFYTIDKPGYVTGGFEKSDAYKNFPLCYECRSFIEAGRELIEDRLKFKLGGMNYYLIPEFLYAKGETIEEVLDVLTSVETREYRLREREYKHILSDEEEILDILKDYEDFMTVHILFLEQSQSAEKILLHIQDIYPSRLKKLFRIKEYVERIVYNNTKEFTYRTVYRFFSKTDPSKRNPDLKKQFLELIDRTFRGIRVNRTLLVKYLLRKIASEIREDSGYIFTVKDAFGVFLFTLITTGELEMAEVKTRSLEEFVNSLPALDTDLKKGLFLLGALTERLLRAQASERGSKPFLKKLRGLKMNETDMKGLLPEVRNKLEEYQKFGKGESIIFNLASEYLIRNSSRWNMSVEELNFYFALGMGMFDRLAEFIYRKEGTNHEEQA